MKIALALFLSTLSIVFMIVILLILVIFSHLFCHFKDEFAFSASPPNNGEVEIIELTNISPFIRVLNVESGSKSKTLYFVISNPPIYDSDALRSVASEHFQLLVPNDTIEGYTYYTHEYYKETQYTPRDYKTGGVRRGIFLDLGSGDEIDDHIQDILITITVEPRFNEQTIAIYGIGRAKTEISQIWRDECPSSRGQDVIAISHDASEGFEEVRVGNLVWTAKNLNHRIGNSWCYDNSESNCKKYGRLYDWNTAMRVCPNGWHLPSNAEWEELNQAVGDVSEKIKSKAQWGGSDDYGWAALPGGKYDFYSNGFDGVGSEGNWWSSTASDGGFTYSKFMNSYSAPMINREFGHRCNGYSVRCVKKRE